MPYIKISDPNTIDLAAWHQVITVVNQHSDSINAITNNFGVQGTGSVDWNGSEDFTYEYDPGSQKMIYGRTKIDTRDGAGKTPSTTGDHVFYTDIIYANSDSGTASFSARPVITATARFGSNDTPPSTTDANVVVTVIAVTEEKFTVRVTDARSTITTPISLEGYFYINWVAVGPK
jgi:hypothetical protein